MQVWVLSVRFMRSWWRNPEMFWSEMVDYAVFSIFLGASLPPERSCRAERHLHF